VNPEAFVAKRAPGNAAAPVTPAGIERDRVLLDIVDLLGTPYRYGGSDRDGIDCSGFTARVYRGASLPALQRSTREQFRQGRPVQRDSLQFGDLVFFNTTGDSPSHVGLFIEDNVFAHASVTFGVTLSSLQSTYYRERYIGARRVVRQAPRY
jgi:cell wall-associated NlpC family hydrolase